MLLSADDVDDEHRNLGVFLHPMGLLQDLPSPQDSSLAPGNVMKQTCLEDLEGILFGVK